MKGVMGLVALWPVLAFSQAESLWGDETKVSVGVAAGVAPEYVGGKDFRFAALPHVRVSRGIFFADVRRGVGVQYRHDRGFAVRTSLAYDPGRGEKRRIIGAGSDKLRGMGEIDAGVLWNVAVSQAVAPWLSLNAEANVRPDGQARGGHDFRIGLESKVFENQRDTFTLNANVHFGDRDFNQAYFGVTAAQAARSGFRAYAADGGVYGVSAGAAWSRRLDEHWTVGAHTQVMQLSGDAADSPIVGRKTQASAMATLRYDF